MGSLRAWPTLTLGAAVSASIILLCPAGLAGQMMSRTATTLETIRRHPTFFHDKAVALIGTPVELAGGTLAGLSMEAPRQFVIAPRSGRVPFRPLELRGRLFDIGRFASDDSRLGPMNLPALITTVMGDRWPAREQLLVLHGSTWNDVEATPEPTMRNLALQPERFEGRTVTLRGRFRGRNLLGDLPAWPRQSEWDFVLQTADAAIWVVGKRPRGDGFDLATSSRAQTGRWLEVTGRVKVVETLPMIVADRLRQSDAATEAAEDVEPPPPALPAPEVVFSAPAQGEAEIAADVVVRAQFSRPVRPESLEANIKVRYAEGVSVALPKWTVTYRPAPMAAEIRFAMPLAGGVGVIVEFGSGIQTTDGANLTPMTLRFTTSGFPPAAARQSPRAPAGQPRPGRKTPDRP
jgi:hypothetical protein